MSDPAPDIAVVPGAIDDYRDHHPSTAVLVVEVADTSLEFDRTRKMAMYARAGMADYWILNLADRRLEVSRDPRDAGYAAHFVLGPDDVISPLAAPQTRVHVAAFFP